MTTRHPITGEILYSAEELDILTTQYIDQQTLLLEENLKKRKKENQHTTPTAYA